MFRPFPLPRYLELAFLAGCIVASAQAFQDRNQTIPRGKEKKLKATIDISFGTLSLERGTSGALASVDYREDPDEKEKLQISYDVSGDEGLLKIRLRKSSKFWKDDDDEDRDHDRRIRIEISGDLPVSFDVELGAGRGNIDLSGLQVSDLKVSTGASSVSLTCDEPNKIAAEDINIESGVSKFTATNLCNTNFRRLKFSGGVGAYRLDFGGKLHQSADARVEVGLGSVSVTVPRAIATKLLYDEGWLSSFDVDDDFTKERNGVYLSVDRKEDEPMLSIQIESGLGSVKVRRK
ncbi:MAG TPA: hypothetical protein VMM57_08650 [Bacteroidota bacterium]|nr:hypothetical protein [Bacteroidota bacterium]